MLWGNDGPEVSCLVLSHDGILMFLQARVHLTASLARIDSGTLGVRDAMRDVSPSAFEEGPAHVPTHFGEMLWGRNSSHQFRISLNVRLDGLVTGIPDRKFVQIKNIYFFLRGTEYVAAARRHAR